jgi:E3 ubiquitin-protein ligase synoviolin
LQQQPRGQQPAVQQPAPGAIHVGPVPIQAYPQPGMMHPFPGLVPQSQPAVPHAPHPMMAQRLTRHVGPGYGAAIPAGSPDLPEGVVIPPGWSLLPLQRLDGDVPPVEPAGPNAHGPAQDILRSVFAQMPYHARSRGTSPAPGTGLPAQAGRTAAAPTSQPPESARAAGMHDTTAAFDITGRGPPPLTQHIAPFLTAGFEIPLQPGHGERSIGQSGSHPETNQGQQDEPGESSGTDPTAVTTATAVNGVAPIGSSSRSQVTEVGVNGSTRDRGPRAVTVEEANDDEDEQ